METDLDNADLLGDELVKKMTFEESLTKLEEKVKVLDSGEKGLQESVQNYKEALILMQHCQQLLEQAKLDVKKINESIDKSVTLTDISGNF